MSQSEVLQGLDQASQKHEKELVTELVSDRILHFLGVYIILLLAIVTKISEITGHNLTCFPMNEEKANTRYVTHANVYCWESSDSFVNSVWANQNISKCNKILQNQTAPPEFLTASTRIKRFIQWMPYAMLLEALFFALPMAFWHYVAGANLMGHLKFIQLLLQDIYESVKTVPAGIYQKKPYDKDGLELKRWRKWKNAKHESGSGQDGTTDQGGEGTSSKGNRQQASEAGEEVKESCEKAGVLESDGEKEEKAVASEGLKAISSRKQSITEEGSQETSVEGKNSDDKMRETDANKKEKSAPTKTKKFFPSRRGEKTKKPGDREGETHIREKEDYETTPLIENTDASSSSGVVDNLAKPIPDAADDEQVGTSSNQQSTSKARKFSDLMKELIEPNFLAKTNKSQTRPEGKPDEDMLDRHIFSMFCYENFASMEHQPYLKSVHDLMAVPSYEVEEERALPLKDGILRQFCHEENFNSQFLVKTYKMKCAFSIALSCLFLVAITVLFIFVVHPSFQGDTFLCDIPYHDHCFTCTFTRLVDVYAAFFANWFAVLIYLVVASIQLHFVRTGSDHALSHFFEDIKWLGGVALVAAHRVSGNK